MARPGSFWRIVVEFTLLQGDCIEVMRGLPDNSVDSVCTDPPYGLKFMGHRWDCDVPSVDVWREVFRVLKPGGHLLSFSGTRTYHRMVVNIEDAGVEIRDQIMWVYGSGFPKSLDVSKAIDKAAGAERKVVGKKENYHSEGKRSGTGENQHGKVDGSFSDPESAGSITAPATPEAEQWQGWGTALKPAHEPICVARKPLSAKTVAANVILHGTGAINIDGCRVELQGESDAAEFENNHRVTERLPESYDGELLGLHDGGWKQRVGAAVIPTGRWPANLMHDGSDEVVSTFPDSKGQQGVTGKRSQGNCFSGVTADGEGVQPRNDSGSAARFFYSSKASKKDRGEGNTHPTVKPTDVCRWLLRLVTPPGGTSLDLYCGSGSFGKAAILEGFNWIGIDRDRDEEGNSLGYLDIARARCLDAQCEASGL